MRSRAMKTVITLSVAALLSACGSLSPSKFSPGQADTKQFDRDGYECERDARSLRANDCDQMDMYEKCMASKGYQAIQGTANKGLCR